MQNLINAENTNMFSEKMATIQLEELSGIFLNIAYQTFALKTSYLERLGQSKWYDTGIENWAQTELILGFMIRDIQVTTIGKKDRQCDLIVLGHSIELRCATRPSSKQLLNAIKEHPKAELYLFLSKTNGKVINELNSHFEQNNFGEKHKMLNEQWMVMIVWKNAEVHAN